jgi:hypothetical protein
MKTYLFCLLCCLCALSIKTTASSEPDSLFTIVDGNIVTIWDMHAHRNCAATYRMEVTQDNQSINWIQRDTGTYAYCYCTFDYSITFGPLDPGSYTAFVYYTESGETTLNIVDAVLFTIEGPITDTSSVFTPFSSVCGGAHLGLNEAGKNKGDFVGQNFPNPFSYQTTIPLKMISPQSMLLIYNSMGAIVRKIALSNNSGKEVTISRLDDNGHRLPPGIYFYSIQSPFPAGFHRMVVVD